MSLQEIFVTSFEDQLIYIFLQFFSFELDLLDRLAGDIVVQIAHKTVEDQIRDVCNSIFDVAHLATLRDVKFTI